MNNTISNKDPIEIDITVMPNINQYYFDKAVNYYIFTVIRTHQSSKYQDDIMDIYYRLHRLGYHDVNYDILPENYTESLKDYVHATDDIDKFKLLIEECFKLLENYLNSLLED